jgi:hypothetical protein
MEKTTTSFATVCQAFTAEFDHHIYHPQPKCTRFPTFKEHEVDAGRCTLIKLISILDKMTQ